MARKYGKKAGEEVKKAVRKQKQEGDKPQTGCRHWALRSKEERRQGAQEIFKEE